MNTYFLLKNNELVIGDYMGDQYEGHVLVSHVNVSGMLRKIPERSIAWQSTNEKQIRSMMDGTLQIKDAETWWLAFVAVCNVLEAYEKKAGTADVIKEIRLFMASVPSNRKIVNTLTDPCNRTKGIVFTATSLVQNLWAALPDSPTIHSLPSWGLLCDLCSENFHVLDLE